MSDPSKKLSKDVELLDRFIRWLSEKGEILSEAVGGFMRRVMPSRNVRQVSAYMEDVEKVNALEADYEKLSQEELRAKIAEYQEQLRDKPATEQDKILDAILHPVFGMVRESAKRTLGMRHYDVQLIGGIVLHRGGIAEMQTGEGKTLVATLAVCLNALAGRGVFLVTVNDYLAKRDRDWMAPVFEYLGFTVGAIQSSMDPNERLPEYECNITYGTNNEFGFDYLRDNMKTRRENQVQKQLHFAVIDEVDSILVDEARTPLIISGMPEASTRKYYLADGVARRLQIDRHYEIKEKENKAILTDEGIEEAQKLVGVESFYEGPHMDWPHHIEQSLRAHNLYKADKQYVKRVGEDGTPEIVIVDEFTGRMMSGRRWSDGLHQAVEAKEGIRIREESQTLATITFQNYFRLYHKLAGMTGTAITEAAEFAKIYKLDVVQVPTNRPNQRVDHEDVIYRSEQEKFPSIVEELIDLVRQKRPTLVGTASIEKSELLSQYLRDPAKMTEVLVHRAGFAQRELEKDKKLPEDLRAELAELLKRPARMDLAKAEALADRVLEAKVKANLAFWVESVVKAVDCVEAVREGLPHNVLNAKYHEREAEIVAQAGRAGAVTIATNMAGRGTDILLGGNPEYLARAEVKSTGNADKYEEYLERFKVQCAAEKEVVLAAGGLHVLGTERHESRRIDNQLRGRTARQGDPGSSRFYLSLGDDLMRIFASDRMQRLLEMAGMTEGVDIQSAMVSRSVRRAQKKVESRNFEIRKNLLEYDEVMDKQRRTIYGLRQEIIEGGEVSTRVVDMVGDEVRRLGDMYMPGEAREVFDLGGYAEALNTKFGTEIKPDGITSQHREQVVEACLERCTKRYHVREAELGDDEMRKIERYLLLHVIDQKWKDHLLNLDALREGIGLRQMGQVDPKNEFKKEGFRYFDEMLGSVGEEVTGIVFRLRPPEESSEESSASQATARHSSVPVLSGGGMREMASQRRGMDRAASQAGRGGPTGPIRRQIQKVGRNDPCPCGSGAKYKKCHGKASG